MQSLKQELHLEPLTEIHLPTAILAFDLDTSEARAFAACLDGGIYEIELASGEQTLLARHDSYASGVRYLSRFNQVISAGYDGTLQWHDLLQKKTIRHIQAHKFWSWQIDLSSDQRLIASVTGQYLAGGYKYQPAPEQEPGVRVYDAQTGELRWSFSHIPPVLSVAFSPNDRFVAAANMMGEIRVWDLETGRQTAAWTTPDFTSWGIIKSHHYIGGIFALAFSHNSTEIVAAGMGPMNDPMAGNGKQTWQRFAWQESPPRKTAQINEGDAGNGLMETLRVHPSGDSFVMAGRMAQGKWNTALFDSENGQMLHSLDTKMRVTNAAFSGDGTQLFLAGAVSQERKRDGKYPNFGRIKSYRLV
jgi:WD40 repeat protein